MPGENIRQMLLGDAEAALKMVADNAEVSLLFCLVNGQPGIAIGIMREDRTRARAKRFVPLFLRVRPCDAIATMDGQAAISVADGDPLLTEVYGPEVSKKLN